MLALYASENGNPGNRKGVRIVLIELSAAVLGTGIRLVDTPGIGSVFEPNSETTRSFLPRIDVAIVVLGSDPPITGEELSLIESLKPRVDRFFFVMNKCDLIPESSRRKAEEFTRHVLTRALGREPEYLVHCSALNALRDEADQGVAAISKMLEETALRAGRDLASQSAISAARYLAGRLIQQIELEREGLIAPLARLDENIRGFNQAMNDIDDLMLAARTRVEKAGAFDVKNITKEKENFLSEKTRLVLRSIEEEAGSLRGDKRHIRNRSLEIARQGTKSCVEEWRSLATDRYEEFHDRRLRVATDELNRLTSRVSEAASEAFGIPIAKIEIPRLKTDATNVPFEFHRSALAFDLSDLLVLFAEIFLTNRAVTKLAIKRSKTLVAEWLMTNTYQVDETLTNWLDGATRQLTDIMRRKLDELGKEIIDAVSKGRGERELGEAAVAERLKSLEKQRARLSSITINGVVDYGD